MYEPAASLILITHNAVREKHFCIGYVLKSLRSQEIENVEVIIVDDSSTDGTTDRIKQSFPTYKILQLGDGKHNIGYLRNAGAAAAKSETLIFIDDDTVLPETGVLSSLIGLSAGYDFLCGARRLWTSPFWFRHVSLDQSISSILNTLLDISIVPRGINRVTGFRDLNEFTFIGNLGVISRRAFNSVGGFGEEFSGWGFEDVDLLMRLCMGGKSYRILYDDLSVIHLNHVCLSENAFLENMRIFRAMEVQRGHYFHVNHFFRVYEGDGVGVLSKI